ncbi:ubiquitin carboxyl-terminal hydrolase [Endogone sp. FLAS-F59071]|nr:ubiquitin carboxyl-terminal hydrolase [Endogone sp. FLAS-F59071]|eukprot:RUS16821.1 ubiquitin carboxyl-terminal hydrolase [Endogone sp. FLAS-F59071]
MADAGNWCLIESDPGVFTELIADIGVKGIQVEEIWSLDDDTLEGLKPIHGLIFLFKWQGAQSSEPYSEFSDADNHVFFAQQVITNACATQAILSILLNSSTIELGEELTKFKSFAAELPPDMKGLAISNSVLIRSVHNSFARSDPFVMSELRDSRDEEKEDLFHFISYLPVHGALYELDGLSRGPVNLGPCTDDDWLAKVRPVIQARMAKYTSSEIRFNLMALIRSRPEMYEEQLKELDARLIGNPNLDALNVERVTLENRLAIEKEKFRRYKRENALRKHNFIPLIYNLLHALAKRGELAPLIEEAKKKGQRDEERRRERERESGKSSGMEM